MLSLSFSPYWYACLARFPVFFGIRSLSHFLPFEVHNSAAAVQSSGPRGARLSGTAGYHSIRIHRRPRHLQRGDDALRAAAGHHGADAPRTHAPTGEDVRACMTQTQNTFIYCVSLSCRCQQSLAQQALMGTINSSMQAVQQAQADLGYVDNPPPLGHDLVIPFFQKHPTIAEIQSLVFFLIIFKVGFRILNCL